MAAISSTPPAVKSLWERWSAAPDDSTPAERRVHTFAVIAYPLSLVVHFLYIFLFAAWDVWPMAIFNIFSVIIWIAGTVYLRRRRLTPAMAIPFFEVLAHATLVIVFFGWGFGGQYLRFRSVHRSYPSIFLATLG